MIPRSLTLLTPLALAVALSACGARSHNSADANTTVGDSAGTIANNSGMPTADESTVVATPPNGQMFADLAARSDAFEIASAKLAQANGASADVKSFAAKMIAAHTESTAKIKKAAAAASPAITPDPTLMADQKAQLDKLGPLKGADFDRAYLASQATAHEQALALMRTYAAGGDTPSLKTAAGEIAPVVQDHIVMLRAINLK